MNHITKRFLSLLMALTLCLSLLPGIVLAEEASAVAFSENGTEVSTLTVAVGETVTMPAHSGAVPADYTFLGWVTAECTETTIEPETVYSVGDAVTVDGTSYTFYALYTRLEASGSQDDYLLYTGELTEGNYLVTYDDGAMEASLASSRFVVTDITPVDGVVSAPAENLIWTAAFTEDGYLTLYNESTASYAASTGAKNKGALETTLTDNCKWTVSGTETYDIVNVVNSEKNVNATLRRNGTYGFATYAASTGGALTLYKQSAGTVYYATTAGACAHANTTEAAQTDATCTEVGYTAGVFCNDCSDWISGHEQIAAPGHSYDAVVTEPTATEEGYTTYTCSACGDSYVSDYVDALGETYTVAFLVPSGVEAIAPMECNKTGITLPTAGVPTGEYAYTFLGWTTDSLSDTTTEPTILTGSYIADSAVTLYPVYCYTVGGSDGGWSLVTDAATLEAGDLLVLAQNSKGIVAGDISSQYLSKVEGVFSEDLTTLTELPTGAVVLTLGGSEGAWTLANSDGALLGATAVKKVAWDKGTTTWSITIDETAGATIQSGTETYGRFLYNVNSPRFTTYTSNATTAMLLPQLYRLSGSLGTTYYTSMTTGTEEEPPVSETYYLFGYINGANYACEDDHANMGDYKFVDGKLTATFTETSYVAVKTEGNGLWYMTNGWQGEVTSADLYDTNTGIDANKLMVPGNVEVTFTLTENEDGSLTLSYETAFVTPTITLQYPSLSLEDEVVINIYYTASDLENLVEMGLITYSASVDTYGVDTAESVIPGYSLCESNGYYRSSTKGIAAKNLGDTVYFAVYAQLTDGSYVYTNLNSYSPKTYAYNQLESGAEEMKPLMVAMLNYGAAAQTYFSYNTDALINADLTEEQKALAEDYSDSMIAAVLQPDAAKLGTMVNNGGYSRRYPSVSFEGSFGINYYFVPGADPVGEITMYVWDQAAYDAAETLSVENAAKAITMTVTDSGEYVAVVDGIVAKNLDNGVYVSFCYSDGTTDYCSGVVGYSIGLYCKGQAVKTGTLADLTAACAVYGNYAKQLFA